MVMLESMQDGVLYSNLLLKLYLMSLKHGGRLHAGRASAPTRRRLIATFTRQQVGTVETGLARSSLKLGLVESAGPTGHFLHEPTSSC